MIWSGGLKPPFFFAAVASKSVALQGMNETILFDSGRTQLRKNENEPKRCNTKDDQDE